MMFMVFKAVIDALQVAREHKGFDVQAGDVASVVDQHFTSSVHRQFSRAFRDVSAPFYLESMFSDVA